MIKVVALQDESSETDDTSEAGAREGHGLAGTGSLRRRGGGGGRNDTAGRGSRGDAGGLDDRGRSLASGRRLDAARVG